MKINKYMAIIICLLIIIIAIIFFKKSTNSIFDNNNLNNTSSNFKIDEEKFENEYESLNDVKKDDNTNKYVYIDILKANKMKYSNYDEISKSLKNETCIIYFGFPECPWCRRTLPVFLETISEYNIDKIYYFNALSIRDKKHLDENGIIVTDKEGTEEYHKLVELLKDFLGPYDGLNDSTIKRLYFPTYVFVKDGKIIGTQIGSVDSYTSTKEDMTNEQKQELKEVFENYLDKIYIKKDNCNDKVPVC